MGVEVGILRCPGGHPPVGTASTVENGSTSIPMASRLASSCSAIAPPRPVPSDGLVMPSPSPSDKKEHLFAEPTHISHGIHSITSPSALETEH